MKLEVFYMEEEKKVEEAEVEEVKPEEAPKAEEEKPAEENVFSKTGDKAGDKAEAALDKMGAKDMNPDTAALICFIVALVGFVFFGLPSIGFDLGGLIGAIGAFLPPELAHAIRSAASSTGGLIGAILSIVSGAVALGFAKKGKAATQKNSETFVKIGRVFAIITLIAGIIAVAIAIIALIVGIIAIIVAAIASAVS